MKIVQEVAGCLCEPSLTSQKLLLSLSLWRLEEKFRCLRKNLALLKKKRSRSGVLQLSLTMYLYSISTDEHVPLKFLTTKWLSKITKIHCIFN